MMPVPLIGQGFIAAVNHVLVRSQWALERLQAFSGQHFRIDANPVTLDAGIGADGLLVAPTGDAVPDVVLSLPLAEAPLVLAGGMDRLMNRVGISGNAELAEVLGFVFRNLSWDVEEDLSRIVGDIPAHRIVSGARSIGASQARALEGLSGNLAEYLTEEGRLLAVPADIASFRDEVSQLRDAVARMGKRVDRLNASSAGKPARTR